VVSPVISSAKSSMKASVLEETQVPAMENMGATAARAEESQAGSPDRVWTDGVWAEVIRAEAAREAAEKRGVNDEGSETPMDSAISKPRIERARQAIVTPRGGDQDDCEASSGTDFEPASQGFKSMAQGTEELASGKLKEAGVAGRTHEGARSSPERTQSPEPPLFFSSDLRPLSSTAGSEGSASSGTLSLLADRLAVSGKSRDLIESGNAFLA